MGAPASPALRETSWPFAVSEEGRRNLYGLLIAGAVVAILGFIAWRPGLLFGLSDGAVANSLAGAVNGGNGKCHSVGDDRWRCTVDLDPGSGDIRTYLVEVKGGGCWRARPARARPHTSALRGASLSGCPNVFDY